MSKTKRHLRIIGDAHGIISRRGRGRSYCNLIQKAEYSLQIGDFGFDYTPLEKVDATRHRILAGNHDNYDAMGDYPHFLGDFGTYAFPGFEFFFVRGGYSIDYRMRVEGISWWPEEELNYKQMNDCVIAYQEAKPEIVISHEAPVHVNELICTNNFDLPPSQTSRLLQHLFELHQPRLWLFGHWHKNWRCYYDGKGVTPKGKQIDYGDFRGTYFYCLAELGYLDFDENGEQMMGLPG